MHRILRRSVPAGILHNAATSRHRPLSSSFPPLNHNAAASGESSITTKRRFSSVLTTVRSPTSIGGTKRFESTTAVSDALALDNKLRFLGVTTDMKDAAAGRGISVQSDKDNGTITFTGSGGVGTRWELVDYFTNFLKDRMEEDDSKGDQFDVGFHSALLATDRAEFSTKCPISDKQYVLEVSANSSSCTLREETDPAKLIPRGKRLTLYLKNDHNPVEAAKQEEETTEKKKKTKKPIWLRNSNEVTREEYNEFYKKTFNDQHLEPLASSHFTTEGEVEFWSVLYVPSKAAKDDDFMNPTTNNIRLYVKRVFISDDFDRDLLPRYLSFVKGVVDTNDLPFNVSREILLKKSSAMRKRLLRKTFDMILGISNGGDYEKFWDKFGKHLMLGCIDDPENHKRIAPLLRFPSYRSSKEKDIMNSCVSLDEYVENMKPDQKDIYYMIIASDSTTRNMQFLADKDIEVLFLVDHIDVVAVQALRSYKDKNFVKIREEDFFGSC